MSDEVLTEEILQFGEEARLFGILTLPGLPQRRTPALPVFVLLSCGVLHRVGPLRLHVRLARTLAQLGFISFRVDLTGRGDSPGRPELRNEQSLAADYREIVNILETRLGRSQLVLAGLCSGADNALVLAQADRRVIGLLLMDPSVHPEGAFRVRRLFKGSMNLARYLNPANYFLKLKFRTERLKEPPLVIGTSPTREQVRGAFQAICERKGRALSVFTSCGERHGYCLQSGQLGRIDSVAGYQQYCTERLFSGAGHTFDVEQHRRWLLDEIKAWAAGYL